MFLALTFGLLGAITGSFVGVIAERLHTGQSFVTGRSRCNSCARTLEPLDLIPVLSWMRGGGRCRTCKAKVPVWYVILEVSLGILFALSYIKLGLTVSLGILLPILAILACVVVYDLRHTIVPPEASLVLCLLSLGYAFVSAPSIQAFGSGLFGAGCIGFGFLLLYLLSKGRAMGLGDAPIAFALSLLTAPNAFSGLLFSFWIGALCGIGILVMRRGGPKMGIEVPFVPFLALGFLLAYFTGWNPFFSVLAL